MNVMTAFLIPTIDNNKGTSSIYMLDSSNLWHGRLGHVNHHTLHRLINLNLLPKFEIDFDHKCETCVEAKMARASFKSVERSIERLDLIHSDVCDMKSIQTRDGKKYFITFIDDCTRYCYVYSLRSKNEAIEAFMQYKNEVENQLNKKIKVLRSDRVGNINHLLVSSVYSMVLFIKPLHFIHPSKMELLKRKIKP